MTGWTFRLAVVAVVLLAAAPTLMAEAPPNEDVARQVDEITAPPAYDWLRAQPEAKEAAPVGHEREAAKRTGKREARAREDDAPGCDFEPPEGEAPGDDVELPQGSGGCDSGGSPGATPAAPPVDEGQGCGAAPSLDCGCDPALGDCGASSPGSCGCAGIGQVAGPFGILMGAVALGLVLFLVVRAISRRRGRDENAGAPLEIEEAPDLLRMSRVEAIAAETMMDRAAAAAAAGDYKLAVGWAYLAGISNLGRSGYVVLDSSTTNRAIVESTRRNGGPHVAARGLVRVFEDLFFGEREPTEARWLECRALVENELVERQTGEG